jgi:hypothetical protein
MSAGVMTAMAGIDHHNRTALDLRLAPQRYWQRRRRFLIGTSDLIPVDLWSTRPVRSRQCRAAARRCDPGLRCGMSGVESGGKVDRAAPRQAHQELIPPATHHVVALTRHVYLDTHSPLRRGDNPDGAERSNRGMQELAGLQVRSRIQQIKLQTAHLLAEGPARTPAQSHMYGEHLAAPLDPGTADYHWSGGGFGHRDQAGQSRQAREKRQEE